MIETLIAHPNGEVDVKPVPPKYEQALEAYRDHLGLIGFEVHQQFSDSGMEGQALKEINSYMSSGLEAALKLGDLSLLNREIGWVEELIVNHMPEDQPLPDYLDAYYQAVEKHLGDEGRLITEWLEDIR